MLKKNSAFLSKIDLFIFISDKIKISLMRRRAHGVADRAYSRPEIFKQNTFFFHFHFAFESKVYQPKVFKIIQVIKIIKRDTK